MTRAPRHPLTRVVAALLALAAAPFPRAGATPPPPTSAPTANPAPSVRRGQLSVLKLVRADRESVGTVKVGSLAQRTLTFFNTATVPVSITLQSKTCGCLSASLDRQTVHPDQIVTVTLAATVAPSLGEQVQSARFAVTWTAPDGAPASEQAVCLVRYGADLSYMAMPQVIRRTAIAGVPVSHGVWLRWLDEGAAEAFVAASATCTVPGMSLEGPLETPGSPDVRMFQMAGTPLAPGFYPGEVRLRVARPEPSELVVPVKLTVLPAWYSEPGGAVFAGASVPLDLRLSPRTPAAPAPARVTLRGEAPFTARLATTDGGAAVVRLEPTRPLDQAEIGSARLHVFAQSGALLMDLPVAWFGPEALGSATSTPPR
ncbi:MAG TPA: DUF1573 domain-containing protein [Phycisphaerales bacterium]|nr:DUF1573 domain-containing protein [Phycisphaerales bacterium]